MISNMNLYGCVNVEWLNEISNIDGLDPDANYICGLRPKEIARESKDVTLGNCDVPGNFYFYGD